MEDNSDSIASLEARVRMLMRRLEQIERYANRRQIHADLKRYELTIAKWAGVPPSAAQRDAMLDSLRELERALEEFAPPRVKPSLPPPASEELDAPTPGDHPSARALHIAEAVVTNETHVAHEFLGTTEVPETANPNLSAEHERLIHAPISIAPSPPFSLRRMWLLHRTLTIAILVLAAAGVGALAFFLLRG